MWKGFATGDKKRNTLDMNVSKCFKVSTCFCGEPGAPVRFYRLIHFNPVGTTETKSLVLWFEITHLPHMYSFENADCNTKPWNCTSKRLFQNRQEKEKTFRFQIYFNVFRISVKNYLMPYSSTCLFVWQPWAKTLCSQSCFFYICTYSYSDKLDWLPL